MESENQLYKEILFMRRGSVCVSVCGPWEVMVGNPSTDVFLFSVWRERESEKRDLTVGLDLFPMRKRGKLTVKIDKIFPGKKMKKWVKKLSCSR